MAKRYGIGRTGAVKPEKERGRRNDIFGQYCPALPVAENRQRVKAASEYWIYGQSLHANGKRDIPVPDYTTLCRRQRILPASISERLNRGKRLETGIDSTGLKVCGEGEWKVRKHGYGKRCTWRKLHICIDLNTWDILSVRLTENGEDDSCAAIKMLQGKTGKIKRFTGDGAYDRFGFGEVSGKDVEQVIPPLKNAVIQKGKRDSPLPDYLIQRNKAVEHINLHGSKSWKQAHGYHRRSLNEVVMFRHKTVFGSGLNAGIMENQKTEVELKCSIPNKFTGTGMPDSYISN